MPAYRKTKMVKKLRENLLIKPFFYVNKEIAKDSYVFKISRGVWSK